MKEFRNYFNEHAMGNYFKHLQMNDKLAPCIENIPTSIKLEPMDLEP